VTALGGETPRKRVILVVLLAAAVGPYLVGLGDSSLWDANESFYAETARTMVETGDYVNPTFNGKPRFNKPVLPYWIVVVSYHIFGVSEWAERLPIALGGLVLVATAFALGKLLGGVDAGLLAAIVLATAPRVLMFSRRIIIDVHLAMFAGLTLLCFALAETYPDKRRRYLTFMYVAAGLGVLTKGPVAIVVPGIVFLLHLALERRLADVRTMRLPVGALIGAAIVLPWYVLVYQQHGWQYIESFVLQENILRYTQTIGGDGRGPLFYLPVMLDFLFPWSLLIPLALWAGTRRTINGKPTARLLVLWIAVFVGFFSLSNTKQDLYILPIVPALAALIGGLLAGDLRLPKASQAARRVVLATGLMLFVLSVALLGVVVVPGRYPLSGLGTATVALGGCGLTAAGLAATQRQFAAVTALGVGFAVISWSFVSVTLPDFERYKPVRPLAAIIESRASPSAVIGSYRLPVPSMVFYLQRPILELHDPVEVARAFASDEDVYFVMPEADYRAIRESLAGRTYVVDSHRWLDARLSNLLNDTAFPEIVLVSNRDR